MTPPASQTFIYAWFSWRPSELLSTETNTETKTEERFEALLSVLQENGETLKRIMQRRGPTHIGNQSLQCPRMMSHNMPELTKNKKALEKV